MLGGLCGCHETDSFDTSSEIDYCQRNRLGILALGFEELLVSSSSIHTIYGDCENPGVVVSKIE